VTASKLFRRIKDRRASEKARSTPKARRVVISDDEKPVIVSPGHRDRRNTDDDSWPMLPQKKPGNEDWPLLPSKDPDSALLEPEPYRPHLPLPESATVFQVVRRLAWIMMVSIAAPLALTIPVGIANPDEAGLAETQAIFAIGCAICFLIAYFDELFLDGDN
jgi:hypothetical protein